MTTNDKIDELESVMNEYPKIDCPLTHRFVGGLYIREIFMPAGSMITSMIHKTTHPFFVMRGKVSVYSENDGTQLIEAPYIGTTTPNTRRVLYIHEATIWATTHITDIKPEDDSEEAVLKAVQLIEERILEMRENPLLGGIIKNNVLTKSVEL